jgi:hypothetical protein
MSRDEFEKLVLMELKRLNDRLDRLTDLVEENLRYLEEMVAEEAPHLPALLKGHLRLQTKEGLG